MGFTQDRLEAVKAQIIAAEEAELAIMSGEVSSYSYDSGQTRQSATKHNIASLRSHIDALYNRYYTLRARLYGSGSRTMRPDW